jgi:hypothetical protein
MDKQVISFLGIVPIEMYGIYTTQKGEVVTGILLPGWVCEYCQSFNGTEKEDLKECRSCDRPKDTCSEQTYK